jgi:hypothetical protein
MSFQPKRILILMEEIEEKEKREENPWVVITRAIGGTQFV